METVPPVKGADIAAAEQRRVAQRRRVLKSAKIILDDMRAIDCTLRDMSDTGAKIMVASTAGISATFRLFTVADNTIRDAEIAWKRHDMLGVNFTSTSKPATLRKF